MVESNFHWLLSKQSYGKHTYTLYIILYTLINCGGEGGEVRVSLFLNKILSNIHRKAKIIIINLYY